MSLSYDRTLAAGGRYVIHFKVGESFGEAQPSERRGLAGQNPLACRERSTRSGPGRPKRCCDLAA